MKKIFSGLILAAIEIFLGKILFAQNTFPSSGSAGIGTTTPAASSILEVKSTTQGVLIPRMTKTQRDAIVSLAQGLLIYQTNSTPGLYYYDGGWSAVTPKNANKSLSNLTAPIAVNVELLPAIDNTLNLGSSSFSWKDLYLDGSLYLGGSRFLANAIGTGSYNTALGDASMNANTSGYSNTALGYNALFSNTSGYENVACGNSALYSNLDGYNNTATGRHALYSNTGGFENTADGMGALYANQFGTGNTAIGYQSLNQGDGDGNSAVGSQALFNNISFDNTALGAAALYDNTTGSYNVAVGNEALNNNSGGYSNTALGDGAGSLVTTGSENTFIGYAANCGSAGTLTNAAAIGDYSSVTSSNNFVLGNSSVIGWGFGTTPGSRAIKVGTGSSNGNGAYLTTGGVWTDISDANKKENITELDKNSFLEKILQLKITQWKYKGTNDEYHIGPMADEFHKLFEVGDDSSISSMDKTGVLFLGIQALSEENGKLKMENGEQQKQIDELKSRLDELQSSIVNQQSSITYGFTKLSTSNLQPATLLGQNIPNPFDNSTLIPFRIPKDCSDVSIMITNTSTSEVISVIPVSCNEDHVSIDAGTLASGSYSYTLYVDGKMIDTKSMVIAR